MTHLIPCNAQYRWVVGGQKAFKFNQVALKSPIVEPHSHHRLTNTVFYSDEESLDIAHRKLMGSRVMKTFDTSIQDQCSS